MAEIARGCVCCEPLVDPKFEQLGEQHIACRLGDVDADFYLDGVQIFDCAEAFVGPGGWAIRLQLDETGAAVPCRRCGLDVERFFDQSDGYAVAHRARPRQEVG